jgi:hypothetical protein
MTALYTPLSADIPSAPQLQTWLTLHARRSSDSAPVNNSIALVNDSQLFVPVAGSSAIYEFSAAIRYVTNGTANFKYAWSGPASYQMKYDLLGTQTGTFGLYAKAETDVPAMSPGDGVLRMSGLVYTASAAGTLQFQWAQAAANVSDTVVTVGSYIRLTQVA